MHSKCWQTTELHEKNQAIAEKHIIPVIKMAYILKF